MIYWLDGESAKVYEAIDWKVYSVDHKRIFLKSEAELRAFLQSHPNEDFYLVPIWNREIQGADPVTFNSDGSDIRCGIVRYDSAEGKVVTRTKMKVTYSDKAKQWGEGIALLQQATKRFEEVLGPAAAWVMAAWDRRQDAKGRSVYTLRVSDWMGMVSADFTPDDLRSNSQDRYHWHRLWGDLLQVRSRQQLSELTSAGLRLGE